MPIRELGPAKDIYRAYAGPDVGGFGLLPQSAVPRLDPGSTLPSELGRFGIDEPLPYVPTGDIPPLPETKVGKLKVRELGPASAFANLPPATTPTPVNPSMATTPAPPPVQLAPDLPDTRLVNETLVPKGGQPVQLNADQAARFALLDKMNIVQQARAADLKSGASTSGNLSRSALKRIGDAALAAPATLLNVGSYPSRAISSIAHGGGFPGFTPATDANTQPLIHGLTNAPTVDDAAAYAASKFGGVPYNQARETIDIREGAREYNRPKSSLAGKALGDIFTIVAGRAPFAGDIVAATKGPETMEKIREATSKLAPSYTKQFKTVWNSESMKATRRALTKAGETGGEAGVLALLHDGDPVKTSATASGAQLAGSFALSAIKHPYYSMGAIGASALMWQMFKDAIPGGRDAILQSVEHATHVATLGTLGGILAGMFGAGRFRGGKGVLPGGQKYPWYGHNFAENLPRAAEGTNAALRTGPNSLIEQFFNDGKSNAPVIGVVMDKLSTNVNAFTQAELGRLTRTITKGGNLRTEIQDMLKNPDFASRMGM